MNKANAAEYKDVTYPVDDFGLGALIDGVVVALVVPPQFDLRPDRRWLLLSIMRLL